METVTSSADVMRGLSCLGQYRPKRCSWSGAPSDASTCCDPLGKARWARNESRPPSARRSAQIPYLIPHRRAKILCDLNMPGISGFELLSIVRRCYPRIKVVAMSGSYSGRALPAGVAADAFYGKGTTSVADLLQMVRSMKDQSEVSLLRTATSIWISSALVDPTTGGRSALVACPECLRAYPHSVTDAEYSQDTKCPHCSYLVQLSIVPTT